MRKKKKIFIVDDDVMIHKLITKVLSSDEFEIVNAYDGQNIVAQIENEQPDLIMLDIMMPIGDGRDICKALKENPKTENISILMMSALGEHHDRITGLKLGAHDYIEKPFNFDLLVSKIKYICGIKVNPHAHR
ncbi:MAG: response regulator [Nitrospiraceae bacterium]|nr:MAG: response regulator [Nitrospiraceae bacterium]